MEKNKSKKVNWNMLYPEEKRDTRFYFRRSKSDDDLKQLRKLLSKNKGAKLTPRGTNYSSGKTSYNPASSKQFATVKMNYSDKKRSHEKFLKYYMSQENKDSVIEKPILFGKDESAHSEVAAYEQRITGRHFKFMISPESPNVPLKEFTRAYMDRISFELGVKFDWQAAIHTNTAHPHVHILINGMDLDGKVLNRPFPKNFIQKRSHEIASEIITDMIGERTKEQKNEAYVRSFTATRWTAHDEKISSIAQDTLFVTTSSSSEDMHKRLAHLCTLKLARFDNGAFRLQENWQETLRNVGRYNSFLKAKDELLRTQELELFKSGTISGVIRKTYSLNDEWENDNAIVIEDLINKKAYFVPLYNPPPSNAKGRKCTITMNENSRGRLVPKIEYEKNMTGEKNRNSNTRTNG